MENTREMVWKYLGVHISREPTPSARAAAALPVTATRDTISQIKQKKKLDLERGAPCFVVEERVEPLEGCVVVTRGTSQPKPHSNIEWQESQEQLIYNEFFTIFV